MNITTNIRWFLESLSAIAVYSSADYNVPNKVYTRVPYNTKIFDRLGEFDTITHLFTPTDSFCASVSVNVIPDFGTAGKLIIARFTRDIGGYFLYGIEEQSASVTPTLNVNGVVNLVAGESYCVEVYQNSGAAMNFYGGNYYCNLSISRLPVIT
jgi:hypothetical protein